MADPSSEPPYVAAIRALEAIYGRSGEVEPLSGLDFRTAAVLAGVVKGAPWWNEGQGVVSLQGADLSRLVAREANFEGLSLERANLEGADLSGANFTDADLGKSQLRQALLEDANLTRARFRFANLDGAAMDQARMSEADLWGASLCGAELTGADLRGATLCDADLTGADFSGADLRDANLTGAKLNGARFRKARLDRVDLSQCEMDGVHLDGAHLDYTVLARDQLGGSVGEEREKSFIAASRAYMALEGNFRRNGDPDGAVWAYLRRRRMQKFQFFEAAHAAWAEGDRRSAMTGFARYYSDQFVELLCDYGESIPRVLGALVILHLGFTAIYSLTGCVTDTVNGRVFDTHNPFRLAVFSLCSMTTSTVPAGMVPRSLLTSTLMGFEALLAITLAGLLGFVMGNRIRR